MHPDTMITARNVFGHDQANGMVDVLREWFAPYVAELILKWLLKKNLPDGSTAGLLSGTLIRHWLAKILKDNRSEILAFINEQIASAFDAAVAVVGES